MLTGLESLLDSEQVRVLLCGCEVDEDEDGLLVSIVRFPHAGAFTGWALTVKWLLQ